MEQRWNHDIPDEYFTDPRYNADYAPSLNRQDSGHSNGSSRSSDSYYSCYSARSYTEAPPAYSEQLQSTGSHTRPSHQSNSYYGSSSSSSSRRPTASTRHGSSSSSSSSNNRERFYCDYSTCHDKHGQQSSFSRRADLNRHYQSVHGSVLLDCPWRRCERRGERGFPRMDHLVEHRRGYHHENIPKREMGR